MVFELSEIDQNPEIIYQVKPKHPDALDKAGIDGEVVVRFVVMSSGNVASHSVIVLKGKDTAFAKPAIIAVRKWRFNPGMKDGKSVDVKMSIIIKMESAKI